MGRLIARFTSFAVLTGLMAGCLQSQESSSIVIPPGGLVAYNKDGVLRYNKDQGYKIFLRRLTETGELDTILELTPPFEELQEKGVQHSFILPKGITATGFIVVEAQMDVSEKPLRAIVLAEGEFVQVDLASTLVYELVSNYPGLSPADVGAGYIRELTAHVRDLARERMDLFGLNDFKDFKVIFKFMINALSVDVKFLELAGKAGLSFNYDNVGNVLNAPYPFNIQNNPPEIDPIRSTPMGQFIAIENRKSKIKVEARDRDYDMLFYYWTMDGEVVQKGEKEWEWTPDYEASRPESYELRAYVTDGGRIGEALWSIDVQDVNRPPLMTAKCPTKVKEGDTFECTLAAEDPDGDPVTFTLSGDGHLNTIPTLDGQLPGVTLNSANPVLRWTGDNKDFHARTKVLSVTVDDAKGGATAIPIIVQLTAVNAFPVAILPDDSSTDFLRLTDPSLDPRELDACAHRTGNNKSNPYDPDTDTDPSENHVKFEYFIYYRDPDNVGDPSLDDEITVEVGGTLRTVFLPSSPAREVKYEMLNGVMTAYSVFRFVWLPTENTRKGTIILTPRDNLGRGKAMTFQLEASGRNVIPCPTFNNFTIASTMKAPKITVSRTWQDADKGDPARVIQEMEMTGESWPAVPHLSENPSGLNPMFRHLNFDFAGTFDLDYLEAPTTRWKWQVLGNNMMRYFVNHASPWAGVVVFYRDQCLHSPMPPIVVTKGTILMTPYQESPYIPRLTYQTAQSATLGSLDCAISVPVLATQRTAAAGALNTIFPAIAGLSVTNPTAVNYETATSAQVIVSRAVAGTVLTIPEGTTIRTDEAGGAQSIVYHVVRDYVMPAAGDGSTSMTITVQREQNGRLTATPMANRPLVWYGSGKTIDNPTRLMSSVPKRAVIWGGAPVAGVNVSNLAPIYPRSGNNLSTYRLRSPSSQQVSVAALTNGTLIRGVNEYINDYNFTLRGLDGRIPGTNSIANMDVIRFTEEDPGVTTLRGQPGFSNIRIRHQAFDNPHAGRVEFYRTTAGPDVTIPAGLYISTAEREIYKVLESGAITSATGNKVELTVARAYASTYAPFERVVTFSFREYSEVYNVTTAQGMYEIDAGQWSEIMMSATDNASDPYAPLNPYDRYRYSLVAFSASAKKPKLASSYKLCRDPLPAVPGANPPCQLCHQNGTGAAVIGHNARLRDRMSHEASRHCYLRFKPEPEDIAETFVFTSTVQDQSTIGNRVMNRQITVFVKEGNVAPEFTEDETYSGPLAGGAGTPSATTNERTRFVEGQTGRFTVFAKDANKGQPLKTFRMSLLPNVVELKTGQTYPRPAGMTISPTAMAFHSSGIGSTGSAVIEWTPTDEDAKKFSSAEGFIIGVEVKDSLSFPAQSLSNTAYFKVFLDNVNNAPVIGPLAGVSNDLLDIKADTYVSKIFRVHDADLQAPVGGTFTTFITACRDASGQIVAHPTLDTAPVPADDPLDSSGTPAPISCHFVGDEWAEGTFDRDYKLNRNVGASQCRTGANEALLNADLAVPKITRVGGPYNDGGKIAYDYKLEWCPQRGQVGEYSTTLAVVDNGDLSVAGTLAPRRRGIRPLSIRVTAPVFFKSPLLSDDGSPFHHMKQVAAIPSAPFRYPTIVENSMGNPLEYTLVAAPRACGSGPNGVCVDDQGVITWTPLATDRTWPHDPAGWHRIEIRVRDTVTNDTDQAHFYLQVQDPSLPPFEELPVITGVSGPALMQEGIMSVFSVTASDANANDVLHYRWYRDGKLIEDKGPTFGWRPKATDGSVDLDGGGPLGIGEHTIRVEVTDGNFMVSHQWNVQVRNNILFPVLALNVPPARKALNPGEEFVDFKWNHEVAGRTVQGGKQLETLFFAGSYKRNSALKNFAWSLDWVDSQPTLTGNGGTSWNFFEGLAWPAEAAVRRLAVETDATTQGLNFFLASRPGKFGPYNTTQDAVRLTGDLAAKPSLTAADVCSACQGKLYLNPGAGDRVHVQWGHHGFYVADSGRDLVWDQNAQAASVTVFASLPAGYQVAGMVVNPATKRLFVSAFNGSSAGNFVHVYDIASVQSGSAPAGSPVVSIDVSGADPGDPNIASQPSALVLDPIKSASRENQVFVFLKGTGGIGVIEDPSAGTPSSVSFLGIGDLAPSPADSPAGGTKLVYQPGTDLVLGVSREGRQVFSLDPVTKVLSSSGVSADVDSILSVPVSGRVLLVDRQSLKIFGAQ